MDAGRRSYEGVLGDSVGRTASLQENLVGPGKPGRHHRRWLCGSVHPRKTGGRATAEGSGLCHLGDRPVAFRCRERLDRGTAAPVTEPGLVAAVMVGVFIARLVLWPPVERDIIKE